MIIAQELESQQDISPDVIFPPSDLYSDEPPVESELHLEQIMLLIKCLKWLWKDRYQLNVSTPRSIILHLLDARDLEIGNFVSVLGSSELVSQVINGEVGVTGEQAEILGEFFHVDTSLFIG